MNYDVIRALLPQDLPWTIREAIIGNVVVGNLTPSAALRLGEVINKRIPLQPDLFSREQRS